MKIAFEKTKTVWYHILNEQRMRKSGWACHSLFLEVIMENKNQEYLVKEKLSTLSHCETF